MLLDETDAMSSLVEIRDLLEGPEDLLNQLTISKFGLGTSPKDIEDEMLYKLSTVEYRFLRCLLFVVQTRDSQEKL